MNTPEWILQAAKPVSEEALKRAQRHQDQLTKPRGALGRLEELAIRLAALQENPYPTIDPIQITLFAGDHGIAAKGVSAYPQAVTGEMVRNFANGGAAINVLAEALGANLEIISLGLVNDPGALPGVTRLSLGNSTADFTKAPAMGPEQLITALDVGCKSVERAFASGAHLFIGGEMGIGNTTAATALACALLSEEPEVLTGPGTGLNSDGVERKSALIRQALTHHQVFNTCPAPIEILRTLGGFEIAALVGGYLACGQNGLPALVDGFICSVAALIALRINPSISPWLFFAHQSAEPGHLRVLAAMDADPLLSLGMRLGEGTGAAIAASLLRSACQLHRSMATFDGAGVTDDVSAG